jgi:hypothetical protein
VNESDLKGYYARLGVEPTASQDAIKKAYRRLAKELHPDRSPGPSAKNKFQELSEAYETLSNPEARSAYDALRYTARKETSSIPSEPICCSRCGKVTAQPRATVFTYTISVIFLTIRNPIQGIFCSSCARKTAFKGSLISALAGWWGFPWGPIYTIGSIIKNAMGGAYSRSVDEGLQWFNTLAFVSQGKLSIGYALARQLSTATSKEIADTAQRLVVYLQRNGVPANSPALKDPWAPRPFDWVGHALLLLAVPLTLLGMGQADSSAGNSIHANALHVLPRQTSSYSTRVAPPISQPTTYSSSQPSSAPIAKCSRLVQNGEALVPLRPVRDDGHVLTIENGSGGNAIIKARDALTNRLSFVFFVKASSSASYRNLPDGTYRIQYAIGGDLRADCKSFIQLSALGQFPQETLSTNYTATGIVTHELGYTLYPVAHGNVRPQTLDLAAFNAE